MNRTWIGISAAFVLALGIVASSAFFTVDQGERAVVQRFGAVNRVAEPGLSFKVPGIDRVVKISTQNQTMFYEAIDTYSRDQQSAEIDVSVIFRVPPENVAQLSTE